jgi:hypothetical protein
MQKDVSLDNIELETTFNGMKNKTLEHLYIYLGPNFKDQLSSTYMTSMLNIFTNL